MLGSVSQALYSTDFPPSKLLELPPDIWIAILRYFTANELARTVRVSKAWRTMALAPCLWKEINLERFPRHHLVALRSFFARAQNAPVAVRIKADGQNASHSRLSSETTGIFDLIRGHVSHLRALDLRVRDIRPQSRINQTLEDITGPRFSALRSLIVTPMPILETFAIEMRWEVISRAIPRPFNTDAPNLHSVKLLFRGQISDIPDTRLLPQVQNWHFKLDSNHSTAWPWDWNAIWLALSSRGYFSKTEVLFTARFKSGSAQLDMTKHVIFDKWTFRELELGRGQPSWHTMATAFTCSSSPLPVRARIEFVGIDRRKEILANTDVLSRIDHLLLHDSYEWSFDDQQVLPPIPSTSMPLLKTLTINCSPPINQHNKEGRTVSLLWTSITGPSRGMVALNLEEVRIERWEKARSGSVTVDALLLAHFMRNHVEMSSTRLKRLKVGMRTGLELRHGLEESVGIFADLADTVQVY